MVNKEGWILVKDCCSECGIAMEIEMSPEKYEEFQQNNGWLVCGDCIYADPKTDKKTKSLIEQGRRIYATIIEKPDDYRERMGVPPSDYEAYLGSLWWKEQREKALERAKHRCQLCNRDYNLQVHHRTYERLGCEEPEDLTVLCKSCHQWFHQNKLKF